jgi:hypothetical protein
MTGTGGVQSASLLASVSGEHYVTVAELGGDYPTEVETALDSPRTARFLKVRFVMEPQNWKKVSVWELRVEGEALPAEATELACPNDCGGGVCDQAASACECGGFGGPDCSEPLSGPSRAFKCP